MPKLPLKAKNVLIALSLVVVVVAIVPSIAEAQVDAITGGILAVLWSVVVGFFGKLVVLAGWLLNVAIGTYVVGFGDLYEKSGLGFSIDNLWSTVRDIFNLTFIFGLVFIGFKMIFNSSDSNARRMLGSLILAALLVNFSLFITKFIIDFSNIAATQLAGGFMKAPGVYAVSDGFVNLMGISGLWGTGDNIANMPGGAGFAYVLGSLVLYLVTAFVFAAGGILLIIRFVVLNIYMVLSPLMFLGWVFPGFSNVSREYWRGFMSRAFFAPAYILMIYFAHQILVNLKGAGGASGMANALLEKDPALAKAGFVSTIPYFIITSVFLIAAIVVAQKMGAVGATNVMAIGNRMTGKARKMAMNTAIGTAAFATYAPRAGARMATNAAGEGLTKRLNNLQTGKGWGATIARTNAVDRATRGALAAASGAKFGTGTTNKDEKDYKTKTQSRINQGEDENNRKIAFANSTKVLNDNTSSAEALNDALDALAKSITKMTSDEKLKLGLSGLTNQDVAAHLTETEIGSWQKDGKFNNQEIQQIKDARQRGIIATAVGGSTLATIDASGKWTSKKAKNDQGNDVVIDKRASFATTISREAKDMPISVFKDGGMQQYLTPEIIEELIKNGKLASPEDQAEIRANIQNFINSQSTPDHMRNRWKRWVDNTTLGAGFGITVNDSKPTIPSVAEPKIIVEEGYKTRPK